MAINRYRMYVGPLGLMRPLPPHPASMPPDTSLRKVGALHESLDGRTTLDSLGRVRRSWALSWEKLTEDEETYLQSLLRGTANLPLRLMDPRKRNLLPEDVSVGGSRSQTAESFTDTGAATLAYSSGSVPVEFLGLAAGRLVWTGVTNTQTLYATEEKLPIISGSTYRISAFVKTTTTFRFSARPFDLLGVEGAVVTDATSNASTAGVWTRLSWLYTPAAGVCSIYPGMTATGSGNIETCGWMAQIDEPLANWTYGYGCPQVVVAPQATTGYWRTRYHAIQLALMEV